MHGGDGAFGFGDEVDVFDGSFFEGDCPIWVVGADWGWDGKAVGQFGIDDDFAAGV